MGSHAVCLRLPFHQPLDSNIRLFNLGDELARGSRSLHQPTQGRICLRIHEFHLRPLHLPATDADGLEFTAVSKRKVWRHARFHGRRNVSCPYRVTSWHESGTSRRAFVVAVVRYGLLLHMLKSADPIWYDGKNLLWM